MNSLKQQGFFYGALLYVFLIPFHQKVINIALMLWVLLSLISYSKSTLVKNRYLLLLPAFYLSYFIGVFNSEFFSFKFLEYKLSLLIFPLLFFLNPFTEKHRNSILKALVWGLVVSATVCLVIAFVNSIVVSNGTIGFQPNVLEGRGFFESVMYGGNYFFGRHLSFFHQTVYYAMYLCTGVSVLLFQSNLFSKRQRLIFLPLLVAIVFLISNKASFIALALVFGLKLWMWNVTPSKKLIGVSLFVLLFISFAILNPRFKESAAGIADGKIVLNKEARYGFGTRLLSWDAAFSLIKEKPIFGYGHSNAQNALNARYLNKGYTFPLKESYNAHNLWLQSWLENGVLALLLLLAIFGALFYKSRSVPLLLAFSLILAVNSMFEGLFNRFSGISFFSFLVCFLFSSAKGGRRET